MIDSRLVGWHLVQKSCNHITAEIQLAVFAPSNGKSAAGIEFSKYGSVSFCGLWVLSLIVVCALVLGGGLPGLLLRFLTAGLRRGRLSGLLLAVCIRNRSTAQSFDLFHQILVLLL